MRVLGQWLSLLAIALLAGCARTPASGPSVRVVDFVKQIDHADKRPAQVPVELAEHILDGRPRASIIVPIPSRLTWTTTLPAHAVLHAIAALPDERAPESARFRVGISDDRFYEGLGEWVVSAGAARQAGAPVSVDLGRFAGRQLSLLFPPTNRRWRIVLSIDALAGAGRAAWADAGIDTDVRSARAFFEMTRRAQE